MDTSLPQPSSVGQIDGLQLLRAAAVISVVWCHAGQFLGASGSHELPGFGVFGIDIFFVISGFILSLTVLRDRSRPGSFAMWEFIKKRIIRIYPIYWFVALLTLARLTLSHQIFKHDYIESFFLLPSFHYPAQYFIVDYSWTMSFEIFFYVLLGLVLLITVKRAIPVLVVLLVGLVTLGMLTGIRHPVAILMENPILLEFVFGSVIALMYVALDRRRFAGILATFIGVVASTYLSLQVLPTVAEGPQMILTDQGIFARVVTWGVCAAFIVGGIVFWSPSMKSTFAKFWIVLGNASYSSYVVSGLVLEYVARILFKLHKPPMLSFASRLAFELSMLIAVMAVGVVCCTYVEKPMLRFLQARFVKKTGSRAKISPAHGRPVLRPGSATEPTL